MNENINQSFNIIQKLKASLGVRIFVLFGSFFFLLILTSFVNLIIEKLPFLSERGILLCEAASQCILAFIIPASILARFLSHQPFQWLEFNKSLTLKNLLGVLIVFFLAMPGMEMIIEWNQNIHFPSSLSNFERILRNLEESGAEISNIILQTHSPLGVITGVLIIGLLTGLGEELFFRGALQKIFMESNRNKGLCIFMAAFIFSFLHFQFFGFVPRLLMGIFFGYLLLWSKNIWLPILAHSLNNSWVVIESSLKGITQDSPSGIMDFSSHGYLGISSIIMTGLFLFFFREYFFKAKDKKSYGKKEYISQL